MDICNQYTLLIADEREIIDSYRPLCHLYLLSGTGDVACTFSLDVQGTVQRRRLHDLTQKGRYGGNDGIKQRDLRMGYHLPLRIQRISLTAEPDGRTIGLVHGRKKHIKLGHASGEHNQQSLCKFIKRTSVPHFGVHCTLDGIKRREAGEPTSLM
ncbi:hypothetical protein SDC9_160888 [bioreactor metagenome]|uniref:Uncharacterized protein n=1 Tax=bioreactor metagenome TaxID=1076179 RepID=A0A645FIU9_9ZZZZ